MKHTILISCLLGFLLSCTKKVLSNEEYKECFDEVAVQVSIRFSQASHGSDETSDQGKIIKTEKDKFEAYIANVSDYQKELPQLVKNYSAESEYKHAEKCAEMAP